MTRANRKLVLVADDDADTVEAYSLLLGSRGLTVAAAADGREALFKALDLHPDLVVLDIAMPEMDGLEVLRRLRAHQGPRIPVLVVTARPLAQVVAGALHSGADDVMTKPWNSDELCQRVTRLLEAGRPRPTDGGEPDEGPARGSMRVRKPRRARRLAGERKRRGTPRSIAALRRAGSVLRQRARELRALSNAIRARNARLGQRTTGVERIA
jgi:CheY-like chemotaxis protein